MSNDNLATRQERTPRSPLGIPWPLWIMFITYVGTGLMAMVTVASLVESFDKHIERDGHRVMEQRMAVNEAKDMNQEERLKSLERWRLRE